MLNKKIILRTIGALLLIEAFFLLVSSLIALLYFEHDLDDLLITTGITAFAGGLLLFLTRKCDKSIGKREGYIIVSLVWIIFSIFGAIPFYISGAIPSVTDAFFETMSGFSTTGASILNDIEALPHGLLFWRSITQWLGGMGIIVMSVAIIPMFGLGGMQLFAAEVPGPTADKFHPRVKETAKRLWMIYSIFTLAETILLMIGGMNLFDAINHSFTTMATGGYSTKQASIAYWDSPFIHYVITFFMILAGTNFTLAYFSLKLNFRKLIKDDEFRFYIGLIFLFSLTITLILYFTRETSFEQAFRDSIFQVVSIVTTTGYGTSDYLTWVPSAVILIFILMFVGGSAGSTGGGMKIVRIALLFKNSILEFKRLLHPNAIIPVKFNHHSVSEQVIRNILVFFVLYIFVFAIGVVIMALLGLDFETAIGSTITCLGNIGPGIGEVGPSSNFYLLPAASKWVLSFLMLTGRLELFTVLIILSPAFWKSN